MPCKLSLLTSFEMLLNISYFLQENDEFFELITSEFLAEGRGLPLQAATTRLLYSCSLTWMV